MKLLQEIVIPKESVNDEKVLIVEVFFEDGDFVNKGDVVIEVETSKAAFSIETEEDGYIFHNCEEGDNVLIGTTVAEICDEKKRIERPKQQDDKGKEKITGKSVSDTIFSAKADELIKENELDKSAFDGQDFVNLNDVLVFLKKNGRSTSPTKGFTSHPQSTLLTTKSSKEVQNENTSKTKFAKDKERIVIICPSEIGMEVMWDILEGQENKEIVGYVVDDQFKDDINLPFLDCNVFDFPQSIDKKSYDSVIIIMGGSLKSMQFRRKVFDHYMKEGIPFTNLISEKANIGKNVRIGVGNIIGSGVYIGTGSSIGDNNFISYMTTIGHHNAIGSNNLFAPGVMMSGLVEVGDDCILTTGVNFIDKVKIGNGIVLPLGYCVTSNLADNTVIKMRH